MSVEPLGRTETRALLERHGVHLRRDLGQHFLTEPNVVRRIVEISGVGSGSQVVEVGAGAGTLTRALSEAGARVVAYEVDGSLREVLDETVGDAAEVRFEDAAAVDFETALPPGEWVMVANLPYNVGTPIVLDVLRHVPRITRLVVMLQREAVERLAAAPGSRTYGLPSVVVGLNATVRVVLRVPPHLFFPVPKVESAVALIDRRPAHPLAEEAIALAATALGQRRKMLRSSLRAVMSEAAMLAAGVAPTDRPEDVAPEGWLRLVRGS
ncbi:MAG: 16S rRNA (adenine(1518)-N(6)/adenine(1519)-N(6))-dimethyltransferase RsmA [Acidimicrobiia bacterium]|nr:MAG: 16S rRNA (adenine(1518)-N(6)/adenine(1519)-N(6))-dimethyltransferase RsmA [Acidimicrobiia bacterium]